MVSGASQEAPEWSVSPTAGAIKIDGRLDEPAWEAAALVPLAWEWFPGDNATPPVATSCRVTFDDAAFLVACRADDPRPDEIRAWLSRRDETGGQDRISIRLAPFGDHRRAFEFVVTPLGVRSDAVFDSRAGSDASWDTVWDAAGRIDESGWTVEIEIPFRSLRFPVGSPAWGLIVERRYPRGTDHRIGSMPIDRDDDCALCQAGRIRGLAGVRPGRAVEIVPTLTATRTERRDDLDAPDLEPEVEELDAGVTAGWSPRPGVALSATVNPDFSQVEADAVRLEVNRRFAESFPEKRPFFLEGNEMLRTAGNLDLVFTRTVVDPIAGAKAIGEVGDHGFAAFATLDRVTSLILPGSQSSDEVALDADLATGVARWSAGFGRGSVAGALVTAREGEGYHSRMAAVDGVVRPSPSDRVSFHLAGSVTRYPGAVETDDRTPEGAAGFLRWDRETRDWAFEASWRHVGPGFRADAGFVPRVGVKGFEGQARRIVWGEGHGGFDRIELSAEYQWLEDADSRLLDRKAGVAVGYRGPWQSEAEVSVSTRRERFAGEVFHRTGGELEIAVRPSGAVALGVEVRHGQEVDEENVRLGTGTEIAPTAALRVGRSLEIDLAHRWERLSGAGAPVFTARVAEARLVWHFTVRARVRALLQWTRVERDPAQHAGSVERRTSELFEQLLFAWEVNPGTVLYLGWSDDRAGTAEIDMVTTSRTVFAKVGYAIRR